MVDELKFDDNDSPWEHYKRTRQGYIAWAEEKKGTERIAYPHVTGTGWEIREGKNVPPKVADVKSQAEGRRSRTVAGAVG